MSYYAAFSAPLLLAMAISLVGFFFYSGDVTNEVSQRLTSLVGENEARQIRQVLAAVNQSRYGMFRSIVGTCIIVVGATGMLGELQAALNRAWEVEADRAKRGVSGFLAKKALSLAMVAVVSALLLFSLTVNTILSAFGEHIVSWIPSWISQGLLEWTHSLFSFVLIFFLFAAMFKILPDVSIRWRDVWLGSMVTSVLFVCGNFLLGLYLAHSNPASVYGVAGSLAAILIWIYYASMIVLFGAEFTHVWTKSRP